MNKEYENISFFLEACHKYGIDKNDLFQVRKTSKISYRGVLLKTRLSPIVYNN